MNDLKVSENNSSISLSLPEFIGIAKDVLKEWWVILLIALSAAMVAEVIVTQNYKSEYQSRSTFIVTTQNASSSIASNVYSASETAEKFSQILDSNVLKRKIAQEVGMTRFDAKMEAELLPETNLMELTVTADSAVNAFNIITAVMNNYNTVSDYVINDVILEVLQAPEIPAGPSNYLNSRYYAKRAFVFAALIMIALLGFISYTKDTIKNEHDVSEKVDARLVGTIYHEKKRKSLKKMVQFKKVSMTILNPMLSFRYLEANKMAASRIRSHMDHRQVKVLAVTSVAENEGKSTVAANLALALAQEKKRVLLMDCDFRKPAQYRIFERDTKKVTDLNDILSGKKSSAGLIESIEGTDLLGIFNLKANMHMFESNEQEKLALILKQLKKQLDYIIIDTSPIGLVPETEEISMLADASLLVIRQDYVLARDINDAVDALNRTNGKVIGCVLNDVPGYYSIDSSYGYGYGYGGHYGK